MRPSTKTLGLAAVLRDAGYSDVLTLPCSILNQWFEPQDFESTWALSREEEGVGIAVGLLACGSHPILLIQNSGLGNCVNALASLATAYEVPLVVGVSMRGDAVDENPAQGPMGTSTRGIIAALGSTYEPVVRLTDISAVLARVGAAAEKTRRPAFMLLPRKEQLADES